jgi:putative redox protein
MITPRISLTHEHDAHYHIRIRQHGIVVDQPPGAGGADLGPTPTELFVGSLAGCAAYYVGTYLMRHGYTTAGLRVDAEFEMSEEPPARVTAIRLDLTLPESFPEERRAAVLRVADRCTVHNSIRSVPDVRIVVREAERAA